MPDVLVGPVVGRVLDTEARILVEFSEDTKAVISARASGTGDPSGCIVTVTRDFKAKLPGCFVLSGLLPGTRYVYEVEGMGKVGSFRTTSPSMSQHNIVVASCDKGQKGRGKKVDLFRVLYQSIEKQEIDLVVRNGDQVYADKAFAKGKRLLKSGGLSAKAQQELMLEYYQEIYRATWTEEWVAKCYANCSHIMLLDDHEIRNDWGTFAHDDEKNHLDYITGQVGRVAYYLYQRQLWDPDLSEHNVFTYKPRTEGGIFNFGVTGLVLVDCRGSRSWCKVENRETDSTWIGGAQWSVIATALNDGGALHDCKSVVIVHSTPPIYLSTDWSKCLACCCPCQVDKMGFGLFPEQQADYFDLLLSWRNARPHREIVLVGGDLHHHMSTYIYQSNTRNTVRNNRDRRSSLSRGFGFRQIVASAISNKPPPCFVRYLVRCLMCRCCSCCGPITVARDWEAKHMDFAYERNYFVVKVCNRQSPASYHGGHISVRSIQNEHSPAMPEFVDVDLVVVTESVPEGRPVV